MHAYFPVKKTFLSYTSRELIIKLDVFHEAQYKFPHLSGHGWLDENGSLESSMFWRQQHILERFAYTLAESNDSTAQAQ